ncbi:MAG: phosphotransferase [Gammaproteobacteria bacterium]|nr:phosphotransferase [Gammaproteobacteria bacterium]
MTDKRLEQLKQWLVFALDQEDLDISIASADASFRRYFRVQTPDNSAGKTWVVMDAPPDKEDCKPFVKVSTAFHHMKVNVPEIYAQDLTHGFLVLTDFGSTCYLDKLDKESADQLYGDAMNALISLQTNDKPANVTLPPYDNDLLMREMMLFPDWFLTEHLKASPNDATMNMLNDVFSKLSQMALQQPVVWVHRDYHSRNLMFTAKNNPGIIDFQDAVDGPITYDLVSLLRDCYISWPDEKVEGWVKDYLQKLKDNQCCSDVSEETFIKWFDWMGIQRHLKAIGIFARLNYRDGKPGYLMDIPRTLNYVVNVSARYPELADFNQFVSQIKLPEIVDSKVSA